MRLATTEELCERIVELQAEVERLREWQKIARVVMMFSEQQEVDRTMNSIKAERQEVE